MNSMNIQGTSALNSKMEIIKINALKSEMAKLRVAGYARVSSDSADQLKLSQPRRSKKVHFKQLAGL